MVGRQTGDGYLSYPTKTFLAGLGLLDLPLAHILRLRFARHTLPEAIDLLKTGMAFLENVRFEL